MRRAPIIFFLMTLLMMVVLACGGGQTPPQAPAEQQAVQPNDSSEEYDADESGETDSEENATEGEEAPQASEEANQSASYLSQLKIQDNPRITESVQAELTNRELPFGWAIEYQWWINDQLAQDQSDNTLPAGLFRPKDWIFCMAQLLDDQGNIMQTLRSNRVNVIPLPPKPQLLPIPQFSVPGEFSYTIKAIDPNEPAENPGDTLTYELREPQSENIIIDPKSGLLSWNIDTETAQRLNKGVEISFRIISSWGTSITSSIHLTLTPPAKAEE